jgi:hypothetical protein
VVTTIGHGASKEEWRALPLFLDEWQDLVDADKSLRYVDSVPFAHDPGTGRLIRTPAPWSARWTAHPRGRPVVFQWKGDHLGLELDDEDAVLGELDEPTRRKAEEIAAKLQAELHSKRLRWEDD